MVGRLTGKVAVITGGARGQGEAEVRLFVSEGASVIFGDQLDDLGEALAEELGEKAMYIHHDVREEGQWAHVIAEAENRFGKLDILVNNAGILSFGLPTHEVTLQDYMKVIEVNQVGVFLGMRTAIPAMLRNRRGSIVNISSTGGMIGVAGSLAYVASKFAVRGMTKIAALEYGLAGIRVNSIHPGLIDTAMTRQGSVVNAPPEREQFISSTAIPRAGQPVEVAYLALFLASDESSFCTGSEYLVDGGMLAGMTNPNCRPAAADQD